MPICFCRVSVVCNDKSMQTVVALVVVFFSSSPAQLLLGLMLSPESLLSEVRPLEHPVQFSSTASMEKPGITNFC